MSMHSTRVAADDREHVVSFRRIAVFAATAQRCQCGPLFDPSDAIIDMAMLQYTRCKRCRGWSSSIRVLREQEAKCSAMLFGDARRLPAASGRVSATVYTSNDATKRGIETVENPTGGGK